MYPRRHFIKSALLTTIGFSSFYRCTSLSKDNPTSIIPLQLVPDPKGYLDLPEGFSYQIISKMGQPMSDGLQVPGRPDGMGTFLNALGQTVIVCNHENSPKPSENSPFGTDNNKISTIDPKMIYDEGFQKTPGLGGTTTLVYDEDKEQLVESYLSLAGTYRNCAGGVTPWNSWLTCEEDVTKANQDTAEKDHGFVFEVPALNKGLATPIPLKAMGRFNHEAVAVDLKTGIVYLTEDRHDALFYRFIPNQVGKLMEGGKLQAMAIVDQKSWDTRNWEHPMVFKDKTYAIHWIDLDGVTAPEDDLRKRGFQKGAAKFARSEGIWMGKNELYFACTNGGPKQFGQVFKYRLSPFEGTNKEQQHPGTLKLFAESEEKSVMHMCDNLTLSPWGDVLLCEDNGELNHIKGINQRGQLYTLACNRSSQSELTGAVFSPTGKTLFVNIQENGDTLAIKGPWEQLRQKLL